ncbi:MOSC domain-containing protein [Longispora albida]|uniref:MOSC domain-containing protein n=1 Tax=Longispora albida TaxID=203523 RepID=UPI000379C4FB|nr:MOSC domain-containing protein [Longispora albida]
MRLLEIRRFPVKSLLGEQVTESGVGDRGLTGDRLWAVRDEDGKFGSGKNTRRFRRMPGLFGLRGLHTGGEPEVEFPDGRRFAASDPAGHAALSETVGRKVTVTREAEVLHHDDGPVSVITTAGLRQLGEVLGEPVDPLRFRANLVIGTPGTGYPEDTWPGQALRIGSGVVLRVQKPMTRCVMVDFAQDHLPEHGRILKAVAEDHSLLFGVWATVERPGHLTIGDPVELAT